jgi:two-component system, NtrC family, sensor kinase
MGRRKSPKTVRGERSRRTNSPRNARVRKPPLNRKANITQLVHERDEALEQQKATSEVLSVIASSAGELQPVFGALLSNATRLCEATFGNLFLREGPIFRPVAMHNTKGYDEILRRNVAIDVRENPGVPLDRVAKTKQVINIPDLRSDPSYIGKNSIIVPLVEIVGARSFVAVPMLKDRELIGTINMYRQDAQPFTDAQIQLVKSFASQAVIAIENARLLNELRQRTAELSESLEQQTATSEVLRVISGSPTDTQPVFDMIAESAWRLCEAQYCFVYRFDGDLLHFIAHHGLTPQVLEMNQSTYPLRPSRKSAAARAVLERKVVQIPDVKADPEFILGSMASVGGFGSVVGVPILRDGVPVGSIAVTRVQTGLLSERQIELLKTFADQAVIAVENARLFSELRDSLEQQTATSDVLKVIASSTGELEPVFRAMLENAVRICDAKFGNLFLGDESGIRIGATAGAPAAYKEFLEGEGTFVPGTDVGIGKMLRTKERYQVNDLTAVPTHGDRLRELTIKLAGARSLIGVPMLRDDKVIGGIVIYRQEVRPFTVKQIELVANFAAQAVIAIENARLLNELHQRTDDLTESLEYQTATSEILTVISRSPTDAQPVFDIIGERAEKLCDAEVSVVSMVDGELIQLASIHGVSNEGVEAVRSVYPLSLDRETITSRAVRSAGVVHVSDVLTDSTYDTKGAARTAGYRACLGVPMMRDGRVVGTIFVGRKEPRPYTEGQIQLLKTFADQAVIAIENVRLFEEVQARTEDLQESLAQQTATADVLEVISRSAFDLQPVFETVAESAVRLCGADRAFIFRYSDGLLKAVVARNAPSELEKFIRDNPIRPGRDSAAGRAALERQKVHIPDVTVDPEYTFKSKDAAPVRTVLTVPILKGKELLGVILTYRLEVNPFTDKQIGLLETFADQAAIAIENVRLFDEVRARTEDLQESLAQQTATADVLKIISRSAFDLKTVLNTLLQSAARLCEADQGTITQRKGDQFYRAVAFGYPQEFMDYVKDIPVELGRDTGTGRALLESKVVHIPDVEADSEYTWKVAQKLGGFRTMLGVPMLRDGEAIGVLTLTRKDVRPFSEKQIELVATFADQAAIAIENVRLFESVEARTRELGNSLEELRTAQDRLVQTEKLASLGQLTAGIAHEIKNPLNFVNNFSGVSVELIDELQETLQKVKVDDKTRGEITELTETLRGNLDKVVQHGKRADSIVKNMLLHSRQGSSEHRLIDINAVVEESLNLAYHGARAEKQGFNITLERSLDPAAGQVDVFPQDITRVLLNLVANGFYAATKRKAEGNGGDYEPTLSAATKDLGDSVEIRIRDNGTGIPPDVKEKLFNPFFTTKPAGEGTGLGLSISHDIIVKQHFGQIEVESEPGAFTEFRIILPRHAAFLTKPGAPT